VLELDFLKRRDRTSDCYHQMRFLGSNATDALAAGSLPRTPLGELQCSPRTRSWIWGGRFACLCL